MPKPRKPTHLLELCGAFKHDPARGEARANEPVPTGALGEPPSCLNKSQCAIWFELAAQVPPGVLTNADRFTVELTVRLIAKMRRGTAMASDTALLQNCLGRMGLTPSDRSKVSVVPTDTPAKSPFAEFA